MSNTHDGGTKDSASRFRFLDFVRGFAALSVFFQHATGLLWPGSDDFRRSWFDLGNFGVVIFFLTSGFVIPASLERTGSARLFWVGRFFRLYPLYWLSLFLAVVFHIYGFSSGHEEEEVFKTNILVNSLINLSMLQTFLRVPNAIQPYWTLGLEMLFYFSCTALFLCNVKDSLKTAFGLVLLVCLGGVVVPLATGIRAPVGMFFFLLSMFVGTVFHDYLRGGVLPRQLAALLVSVALVTALGAILNFQVLKSANPHSNTLRSIALTWSSGYLFFAGAFCLRRCTFPKAFLWLGEISYSVYLMHFTTIYMLCGNLHQFMPRPIALGVMLAATLAVSALTFRFVERPGIGLGKVIQGRLAAASRRPVLVPEASRAIG